MNYILVGTVVGIIIGLPLGKGMEAMTQNATKYGIKAAISIGIGIAFSFYLAAGIDSVIVSFLGDKIRKLEPILNYVFAAIFIIFGLLNIIRVEDDYDVDNSNNNTMINGITGFMLGFTHPLSLLAILFLFVYAGIGAMEFMDGLILSSALFIAVIALWLLYAVVIRIIGRFKTIKSVKVYNILAACAKVGVGIAIIVMEII